MSELARRLQIKSGMMKMGEKIAWGSDTALMDEAASRITELEQENARLKSEREAIRSAALDAADRLERHTMITKEQIEDYFDHVSNHAFAEFGVTNAIKLLALQALAMQPRPIAEAPKDGSPILVFVTNATPIVMQWSNDQKMWGHAGGYRLQNVWWTFIPLS